MDQKSKGTILGAALLVGGTSIGGGMLGLPVVSAAGGFIPAIGIHLLCWLFMSCTALLMLEVCLWTGRETNLITMAHKTLGNTGRAVCWALYLFLFYTLTLAYVTECGNLVADVLSDVIPSWMGTIIFLATFIPLIYIGAAAVDRANWLFMIGLGTSFFGFVALGFNHVNPEQLLVIDWEKSLIALPIAFTSFAFQGVIPTLTYYLDHDAKRLRPAILIGAFLPLVCYAIWEWLVIGIVPLEGPGGLLDAMDKSLTAIQPLKQALNDPTVFVLAQFFGFFALTTSFLGVTLGLLDFLADGLNIEKTWKGKLFLILLVFTPPVAISAVNPHIFLVALNYAGGIGVTLLLGLMPILMAWKLRYVMKEGAEQQLPGGRLVLILLIGFILFGLLTQFA
jgi:tyrosine-specific transport protein